MAASTGRPSADFWRRATRGLRRPAACLTAPFPRPSRTGCLSWLCPHGLSAQRWSAKRKIWKRRFPAFSGGGRAWSWICPKKPRTARQPARACLRPTGPNCSTASLGEQETLPYVLKVPVASGITLKILGDAVKRFHRAVGKASCILTILTVFLNHDEGIGDLIKVFFKGVSNVLVEDLLI